MNTCLGNMTGKHFSPNDPDVSNGECLLQPAIPSSLTLTNDLLLDDKVPFSTRIVFNPEESISYTLLLACGLLHN